jgi:ABC-2 type transport system permease protein
MEVLAYSVLLQWKRNLRNKSVLLVYYIIPLGFWAFMGAIFSSVNPAMKDVLVQVLTVMAISTGAILGVPVSLGDSYTADIKKAYIAGNINLWYGVLSNLISAFLHLSIVCIIIFILTPVAFKGKIPENIPIYLLALFLFMITSIVVGTVIGLWVKDQAKLTIYSQVVYMPSLMLSGTMFDGGMLPNSLQTAGKIFPATWGFKAMTNTKIIGGDYVPLLVILGVSLILITYRLIRIIRE